MFEINEESAPSAEALKLQIQSNDVLAFESRVLRDKLLISAKEEARLYQTINELKERNVALGNTKKSMDQKISRLEKENEDFKEESFRCEETLCTIKFICTSGTTIKQGTHVEMVQALRDLTKQKSGNLSHEDTKRVASILKGNGIQLKIPGMTYVGVVEELSKRSRASISMFADERRSSTKLRREKSKLFELTPLRQRAEYNKWIKEQRKSK